ncbi:MAG: TlpA disulfide reductase family protein [Ekhidna sp.]|uniref:TlpA family protein disulfide reductase n=1 Tax=Ekhidna sp. TaxID=2608089 RepID=UPI0032EBF6C9
MKHFFLALAILQLNPSFSQEPTKEQIREVADARKEVKRMKGEPFPDFSLTTINGDVVTSENTKGKILLVNFWFTRCRPCIMEMPEMNEMVEEFKDEEVLFIAPTFDDVEMVDKFLSKRDFSYEIVPDEKDFCLELNVRSYPTHFVINADGIIEKVVIGYSSATVSTLRKSVRKLLDSK